MVGLTYHLKGIFLRSLSLSGKGSRVLIDVCVDGVVNCTTAPFCP